MKFRVTMKTPDALDYALADLEELLNEDESLEEDDKRDKLEEARNFANRWMKWGEYIEVEFDTKEGTATIV